MSEWTGHLECAGINRLPRTRHQVGQLVEALLPDTGDPRSRAAPGGEADAVSAANDSVVRPK